MKGSEFAIQVENLSKYYRLGAKEDKNDSMVSSLFASLKQPVTNYRKYRSLYNFKDVTSDNIPENVLVALGGISFNVKRGEKIGIIGGNGAGKSTLLKVLSRITSPTTGRAVIEGRISSLLEVGTGFHPELTGRENIYLNATVLGMKKSEVDQKFEQIVEFSGVEKFLETPVKRYSSGMKVRLAFAVASHLEPEILIVDEVLAVGDATFQQKCLSKMEDVGKHGRTVLFVSHNMGAITQLCDRVIWLKNGKMVKDGDADTIVSEYLNAGTSNHASWHGDEDRGTVNTSIQLHGARLLDMTDGAPTTFCDFNKPLEIEIEYEIHTASPSVSMLARIIDSQGNVVFTTRDTDTTGLRGQVRKKGRYISKCKMPSFLKPGRYHLTIGANDGPPRLTDMYENILGFDVTEIGGGVNFHQRVGVTTPLLEWNVQLTKN